MFKYQVKVPIYYNKSGYYKRRDFSSDLYLKLDKNISIDILFNLSIGEFCTQENCNIRVTSNDRDFCVDIEGIYADNESYATDIAEKILIDLCKSLTLIVQLQNSNIENYHPKFVFNIFEMKIKEEKYNTYEEYISSLSPDKKKVYDSISLRDSLYMKVTNLIQTDKFTECFLIVSRENKQLSFILNAYYRALGEGDYISKYYNLFTIIEFLEANYKNDNGSKQILNKEQIRFIMTDVETKLNEYLLQRPDYIERIKNTLRQRMNDATDKTRAEKLAYVIENKLQIRQVKKCNIEFPITPEKMAEFINMRNALFHAKSISENEKSLLKLTSELIVLCGEIITKLMQ